LDEALRLIRLVEQQERAASLRNNRRQHARVPVETRFTYQLVEWKGRDLSHVQGAATARTVDVSLGGMAFVTDLELPRGLVVQAIFSEQPWAGLPPVRLTILRSWEEQEQQILAARFEGLSRETRAQLHTLLLNRLRAQ
jgi:c-di-GMP-binding flagellar brake protein YcgR